MKKIASVLLVLAIGISGCQTFTRKQKTAPQPREENADVDFDAFVGRLRKAVAAHDVKTLSTMMTDDFGYRLNPEASGNGVFQYWEEQGLWPELQGILSEKFVKKGDYMVAPPQFAEPALNYDGYRAGVRRVNGSWKFAYFVSG